MTTDLVKYRQLEKATVTAGVALFRDLLKNGDGTASPVVRDGAEAEKLLKLLEQQALERDGHTRTMSGAVALIKYAHKMIERAESVIEAQGRRIEHLEHLATTDELTGLKNRRGFYEAFMMELDKCERGLSQGGLLILIDLDNFKTVNDTHGHMAGDACLRLTAKALGQDIRTMDVAARLGGDEFVLLLSNTCKEQAAGRAQNLAWQLNHLSLAWHGEEIPVRASLGLRQFGAGDKAEHIFNAADIALYENKQRKPKKEPYTVNR
ncbi:MAG: GGDEF domain-containing protein [Rhodospirillales bacterium]|nr:GGDEF domain-containing protein [Rhodospirillales bacterium]MCB9996931.1 GGDEF domain-containing protein [Rhodospirillales bacterium]